MSAGEVVVPCGDLDAVLELFTGPLGFRLECIWPADDPEVAIVAGHGARLRLCRTGRTTASPDLHEDTLELPPLRASFSVQQVDRAGRDAGRAGMRYRDLIPGRQGGRFIASHIRIDDGGPVPDYVHHHRVRFQMIYCWRGWVRVVYEDQGPPFELRPGDCVLQPPGIRHRVLESSAGLDVVEITCPAEHLTLVDHDLVLPTPELRPQRDFGGQTFVRHVAATGAWHDTPEPGWERRDLGVGAGTGGLVDASVWRGASGVMRTRHVGDETELAFAFVLDGTAELRTERHGEHRLGPGNAVTLPPDETSRFEAGAAGLELLEVTVPAAAAERSGSDDERR